MKMNKLTLSVAAIATFIFMSCKKEQDVPGITYQLRTSNATTSTISGSAGSTLKWTSGYASAVEIEFEAEKDGAEVEYKSAVKQKIDLFSPLTSLGNIVVPPGTYQDVAFEVEIQPGTTDAAFRLNGSFTNGNGVATAVVFTFNETMEIEAERENITITDASSLNALSTLNLSLLTTGVTEEMLNNASRNSSGAIEISATSNTSIFNIMRNNLEASAGVEID